MPERRKVAPAILTNAFLGRLSRAETPVLKGDARFPRAARRINHAMLAP
jgi:hypothetical protein